MRKQAHSEVNDLTLEEIAADLVAAIGDMTQAGWARKNGAYASDVCKVVNRKMWPTKAICKALKIERVPVYRRKP
jgi:protein required for attachment to host cells